MIYITASNATKILDMCNEALLEPDAVHSANDNITLHKSAKWVINKLTGLIEDALMLEKIIESEVKIPITEGVLKYLSCINEIKGLV